MFKFFRLIENFWLVFAIISFVYACYVCFNMGFEDGYRHFFVPAIAFMWWLFRRGMRKRMEKNMGDNRPQ
ncbi:MAG TPA: hypothetical protein VIK71_04420 [Flavobacteriales bacterium]